jgi:hypothetical protein
LPKPRAMGRMAKERLADMAITDERGKGKGKKKCE